MNSKDHHDICKEIRNITPEKALKDFYKLKDGNFKLTSIIGNTAIDYFFLNHRLETKCKLGINYFDWIETKPLEFKYKKKLYDFIIERQKYKNHYQALYDVFKLYCGYINAFKPIIAKDLYNKYKPKTILDFSAGWGGRCLGAMVLDINYIGFDTNINLKTAYENMIKTYPSKSDVKMYYEDSSKVDYSKFEYDMVFTSPPYFMKSKKRPIEEYEFMPKYNDHIEFNNKFLFPVIKNTYDNLKINGVYAINVRIDTYEDIKKILGVCDHQIPLIQTRKTIKHHDYNEYIYIWIKKKI